MSLSSSISPELVAASHPLDTSWNRRDRLYLFVLVLATLGLYLRTAYFDFIGYDDQIYIYSNMHVQHVTLDSFRWLLTANVAGNWHPFTVLVEVLISAIFGPKPGPYHLVNSLLHTCNVALLYCVIKRLTDRPTAAFFTALLWGLHPLRVESVAWISELKDVLCGAMWLTCIWFYISYAANRSWANYGKVTLFLILALLAKPMAVTLPFVLLLLDYWPLHRADSADPLNSPRRWWSNRVLEKLPLIACSIGTLIVTVRTQRMVTTPESAVFPLALRIENALVSEAIYLRDTFFPYHLTLFYPHPAMLGRTIPVWAALLAAALLAGITLFCFVRRKMQPFLIVGWLWFLGTSVPVIGLMQVGQQARADRYTYLPSIGFTFAMVLWISDFAITQRILRLVAGLTGTVVAVALAIASSVVIGHWADTKTLFEYARRINPDNFLAELIHATERRSVKDLPEALAAGQRAITIAPKSDDAHAEYGMDLMAAGRLKEAENQFAIGLHIAPTNPLLHEQYACALDFDADKLASEHQPGEEKLRQTAILYLKQAVRFDPENAEIRARLAFQLAADGRMDEAMTVWQDLLQLQPDYPQANGDYADALRLKGDLAGAVEHYRIALANGGKDAGWETNLAYLVATNPRSSTTDVEAVVPVAKDACDQTENRQAAALDAYAACLARVGRFDDAIATAQQAIAQANADHKPAVAMQIQKRLARYRRFLPFVAGDE